MKYLKIGNKFYSHTHGIDFSDPFFSNHFIDITNTNDIEKLQFINLGNYINEKITSIPFILQHIISNFMLNNNTILLHAGAFVIKDVLYIIMGNIGSGKSKIIGELLFNKKINNLSVIGDDKVSINLEDIDQISGNNTFSFRTNPNNNILFAKSIYSDKFYYKYNKEICKFKNIKKVFFLNIGESQFFYVKKKSIHDFIIDISKNCNIFIYGLEAINLDSLNFIKTSITNKNILPFIYKFYYKYDIGYYYIQGTTNQIIDHIFYLYYL